MMTMFALNLSLLFLVLLLLLLSITKCFSHSISLEYKNDDDDVGEPLLLTNLIEDGRIEHARKVAEVHLDKFEDVKSYSGYLTVNKHFNSNLFFWYFPSFNDAENDPVFLWLQGGPGASSMFALFLEHGPFLPPTNTLERRPLSWLSNHSIIYIDNPVGTGYSFTNNGYALNQTQIGVELYNGLVQFFKLFPSLQDNEFWVTGESYAGKYAPAVAYTIMKNNPKADLKLNLQGIILGNPLLDPIHQFRFGDYLRQAGLIDLATYKIFLEKESEARNYMKAGDFDSANKIYSYLINTNDVPSLFQNVTGLTNPYNYLEDTDTSTGLYKSSINYVQRNQMRRALHVGNVTFGDPQVRKLLDIDMMKSVAPWVEDLLVHGYSLLIFCGQFDVMVPYGPMLEMFENLQHNGANEYRMALRRKLYHNGAVYGYLKRGGNFSEVLIRNAGHVVPMEKPEQAYDLIFRYVRNEL